MFPRYRNDKYNWQLYFNFIQLTHRNKTKKRNLQHEVKNSGLIGRAKKMFKSHRKINKKRDYINRYKGRHLYLPNVQYYRFDNFYGELFTNLEEYTRISRQSAPCDFGSLPFFFFICFNYFFLYSPFYIHCKKILKCTNNISHAYTYQFRRNIFYGRGKQPKIW